MKRPAEERAQMGEVMSLAQIHEKYQAEWDDGFYRGNVMLVARAGYGE